MVVEQKIDRDKAIKEIEKKENILSTRKNVENIELKYMPYYLFKIVIELKKQKSIIQHVCVDMINGEYAFVEREKLKISGNDSQVSERNVCEEEAGIIAKQAVKSMLMMQKGKGADLLSLTLDLEGAINYPYWIGYFKRKSGVDFEVIDAVNGKKQGAKMKPVFINLIMQ